MVFLKSFRMSLSGFARLHPRWPSGSAMMVMSLESPSRVPPVYIAARDSPVTAENGTASLFVSSSVVVFIIGAHRQMALLFVRTITIHGA